MNAKLIWLTPVLVLLFSAGISFQSTAQQTVIDNDVEIDEDAEELTSEYDWMLGLNLSQNSYSDNWSGGGSDSFNAEGRTSFDARFTEDVFGSRHSVDLRYGQSRVGGSDFEKSNDRIRLRNQFLRKFIDERWGAAINVNFDSQFEQKIEENEEENGTSTRIFFPGGEIIEMLGISFEPDRSFEAQAGLSMQQIFVRDRRLAPIFGLDENQTFRNQAGFSTVLSFSRAFLESFEYTGYIETFSSFDKPVIDTNVTFVNEVVIDIHRYFTVNFDLEFRYNTDVDDEIQTRQVLSVGFRYDIFESD